MVEQKDGLIVNISSAGALLSFFTAPYGVGKAGVSFPFMKQSYIVDFLLVFSIFNVTWLLRMRDESRYNVSLIKYYIRLSVKYIIVLSLFQLDKMSEMCGKELKKHNVTCLSLWPGLVQTEAILAAKDTIQKAVSFDIRALIL